MIESIIFDTGLIISIIAINMTVIGLTSLAETKNVIGIDYGKFLLGKYKIFGVIRVYYLLILFGVINVFSLFLIFVQIPSFRIIHFLILLVSLIFAIYYFFAYIIIESNRVKGQIYIRELFGLYYSSDEVTTFEPDKFADVCNGSRTTKKMSGNIINYFNVYNSDTHGSFSEIFGPNSFLYKYDKRTNRKRKKVLDHPPYVYRQSLYQCVDISHEFFQLYRYVENQDKWILTILDLFDDPGNVGKSDYIRLSNFGRVLGQINVYGSSDNLFTYKFLEHLFTYYRRSLLCPKSNLSYLQIDITRDLARYVNKQFYFYMVTTYNSNSDPNYLSAMQRTIKVILDCDEHILNSEDHLLCLLDNILNVDNKQLKDLFSEMIEYYYKLHKHKGVPKVLELKELKQYINHYKKQKSTSIARTTKLLFSE